MFLIQAINSWLFSTSQLATLMAYFGVILAIGAMFGFTVATFKYDKAVGLLLALLFISYFYVFATDLPSLHVAMSVETDNPRRRLFLFNHLREVEWGVGLRGLIAGVFWCVAGLWMHLKLFYSSREVYVENAKNHLTECEEDK